MPPITFFPIEINEWWRGVLPFLAPSIDVVVVVVKVVVVVVVVKVVVVVVQQVAGVRRTKKQK
jgi:hypothetical protein